MEIKKQIESINWWHTMDLPVDDGFIQTKGRVGLDHCGNDAMTHRFGLPENMTNAKVLDVGGFDGHFSFESERRGATFNQLVDIYQGIGESSKGVRLAKQLYKSNVDIEELDFMEYKPPVLFDYVFFFGVFYHLTNPFEALKKLYNCTALMGQCLIETAVMNWGDPRSLVQVSNGYEGDHTNLFYPNWEALKQMLLAVGFAEVEKVFVLPGESRATVRAIK